SRFIRSLGPALVVASVVLGPGSLLISSRVGCQYGYEMLWLVAAAGLLMTAMTILGATLGSSDLRTPCVEVAERFGRPAALLVGGVLFLIIVCFQVTNNVAVLDALQTLSPRADAPDVGAKAEGAAAKEGRSGRIAGLVALNLLVVATLYGLRSVYGPVEKLMKTLVLVMLIGFTCNLALARPDLAGVAKGLIPALPAVEGSGFLPTRSASGVADPWWAIQGLIATTLSIAGAFFQIYLAREKQWTSAQVRERIVDASTGIAALGIVSMVVMSTSAAALHGRVEPNQLATVSDVAAQLQPLFGSYAGALFSAGIFAAAFSSFLGYALIGGVVLADALGRDASLSGPWARGLTTIALGVSAIAAIAATATGGSTVGLILFAQALTVLGVPLLGLVMLWLGWQRRFDVGQFPLAAAAIATALTAALAVRTAYRLYLQLS
ncbi:MAG: divalent metal cation transporter, partial [Planctomycetales bacterium]|nr:divalent metal cation transporter [Planctomycetales bacterium]